MRSMIRVALVLALFVVVAASSISLGDNCDSGEPCEYDVTVIGYQNAPRCPGVWNDGEIYTSNSSSVYDYKIVVVARVENDSNGLRSCDNNQPCSGERCEADPSGTFVVNTNDDHEFKKGEQLPTCTGCEDYNCDTGNSPPCTPAADHCTCVIGHYMVKEYSDDGGLNWDDYIGYNLTAITEKESNPLCTIPAPACP